MVRDADQVRLATVLAEEKMVEAQIILEFEGWTAQDIEESGDFDSFGSEDFRALECLQTLKPTLATTNGLTPCAGSDFTLPTDIGGMTDGMDGSYFGESASEQYSKRKIQIQWILVTSGSAQTWLNISQTTIREVRVLVWWGDNEDKDDQVEL